MDPIQCLTEAYDAACSDLPQQALSGLQAYFHWRLQGGFQPSQVSAEGLAGDAFADKVFNKLYEYLD